MMNDKLTQACRSDHSGGTFFNMNSGLKRFLHFAKASVEMTMLVAFLCISFSSFASIESANDFYAEGNYEEAVQEYEALIQENSISTDVYYNLGNAYYKMDNIPAAILNYERALKLKPDNEDALYNLAMANKQTVDKIERLPELFIGSTWRNLVTSKTVDGWAYYAVGVIFLALAFFVGYLLLQQAMFKKISFYGGIFFFFVSLFCWLMATQHQGITNESAEAIIFSPSLTVQSEPNPSAEKLFTLHAGTKVSLVETSNDWSKIKLPNGNVGWVENSAIEEI